MKTENEILALFLETIMNEFLEQKGVPAHITCKVTDLEDDVSA